MPRRLEIDRPTEIRFMAPESVAMRLRLMLFSELEGRVPQGAYQRFFLERITEFFSWRRVEIGPGLFLSGSPEAIEALIQLLKDSNVRPDQSRASSQDPAVAREGS